MKRTGFAAFLITLGAFATFYLISRTSINLRPETITPSPFNSPLPSGLRITTATGTYEVFTRKIENPGSLILIPNFSEKLGSEEIVEKYNCRFGINGGFYTTARTPLGKFTAD